MRTLAFLFLAFVAVITSTVQGTYTGLTSAGLVVGMVGAAFCTVRGLKGF